MLAGSAGLMMIGLVTLPSVGGERTLELENWTVQSLTFSVDEKVDCTVTYLGPH